MGLCGLQIWRAYSGPLQSTVDLDVQNGSSKFALASLQDPKSLFMLGLRSHIGSVHEYGGPKHILHSDPSYADSEKAVLFFGAPALAWFLGTTMS